MEERYYLIMILLEKQKDNFSWDDERLITHLIQKAKESSPEVQMYLKSQEKYKRS